MRVKNVPKSASYFLVTFIAEVTMLILTLDSNLVHTSRTENNTVLEQAEKSGGKSTIKS